MDDVAGLLDGPRARGAFLLRTIMAPPWSLGVVDEAPLAVIAVVRGSAWVVMEHGERVRLDPGGVAIVRGPGHYTVGDDPQTEPDVVIHPGQHCVARNGEPMAEVMSLGVRTWGNDADGSTVMLVGAYESVGDVSDALLRSIPPLLWLQHDDWDCPLIPLLCDEVVKDEPGQSAVLDRLLDLLLIASLRAWFARPGADVPAWYRARRDPIVGRALRLLLNNAERPWTVASLSSEVGVSRAALARRFHEQVGEPPMTFLTERRLSMAADLLLDPDTTLAAVARQVGYSTPYALSTAFKRVRGVSPREHRRRMVRDESCSSAAAR